MAAALALSLAWAAPAGAHDFWIEPESFRPQAGRNVPLRLIVGQDFRGETIIYLPELFERYIAVGPGGEQAIRGIPGDDPAGHFKPATDGLYVVGYRGTPAQVRFDTVPEFEQYLGKEGLERVRELPAYRPRPGRPIDEIYSRCAKALVLAGPPAPGLPADRPLGMPLELIAERSPYAPGFDRKLPVQLRYNGKPLAGALIVAFTRDQPEMKLKLRTDADGRARLPLDRAGIWLVTAVHLFPAARGARADWESLWASLTFELR
jgi:hypothetical protein